MQMKIKTFIKLNNVFHLVDVFGYTTKGIPGIEIVGPMKITKILKEKIVFMNKVIGLKPEMKRYVICIDEQAELKNVKLEHLQNLELPIYILYLKLAGQLRISKLDDCLCSGTINVDGVVHLDRPKIFDYELNKYKLIGHFCSDEDEFENIIPIDELLNEFNYFKFENIKKVG